MDPSWARLVHTSAVAVDGVEGLAEFAGRGSVAVMRCFIRSTGECCVWRTRGKLDLAVVPGYGPGRLVASGSRGG